MRMKENREIRKNTKKKRRKARSQCIEVEKIIKECFL